VRIPRTAPASERLLTSTALSARLASLGRELGEREAGFGDGLDRARVAIEALREDVAKALEDFHRAAAAAGAPHLRIEVSPARIDDKHLRAIEFELFRGRYRAIVTAKSRGDITFVGPFRSGKVEGPCKSFPIDAHEEIQEALVSFLETFLAEAATP
jgi:hypothetical protein